MTKQVFSFIDEPIRDVKPRSVFVHKIVYYNPTTKEITFHASLTRSGEHFIVKGYGDAVLPGETALVEGGWKDDFRLGTHIEATAVQATSLDTTEGIAAFLKHQKTPVVPRKIVDHLVRVFGSDLPKHIDNPEALEQQGGLPEEQAKILAQHWTWRKRYGRAMTFLSANEVPGKKITQIIERFGDDTLGVVFFQPFRISMEINGIGFKTTDRLSRALDLDNLSPERIRAGIKTNIDEFLAGGHCCAPASRIVMGSADLVAARHSDVSHEIAKMVQNGELVREGLKGSDFLFTASMHACEVEVAQALCRRARTPSPRRDDLDSVIDTVCSAAGVSLHINQRAAVKMALGTSISVITGGPGVGKTETMKTLFRTARQINPDIRIKPLAPTGRAAKKLAEATQMPAETIHRALGWGPLEGGFGHDKNGPLEADMVVIDEVSMVDIWLMRDLLRATPEDAVIVLVGDPDQLESVGSGNLLHDILRSKVIPVTRLTKIFRQSSGSSIAVVSQQINRGQMPDLKAAGSKSDMWGIKAKKPELIPDIVLDLVTRTLPRMGYNPFFDIQVLTPGHNHDTGTINLNRLLQNALNPRSRFNSFVTTPFREIRVGDRIMQTENNYELEVYNGDVGLVDSLIGEDPDTPGWAENIVVDFDGRQVTYGRTEFDQLQHAYAGTIHKSQGSEYPALVLVLSRQHRIMLKKELIYTGVTRAKQLCCIVSDEHAIMDAVKSDSIEKRYTALAERLMDMGGMERHSSFS